MIANALQSSRERMPLRDATNARVFTRGHVVLLPPSNQVDLEPAAFFVRSGSRPGPSTISRPFAARMFILCLANVPPACDRQRRRPIRNKGRYVFRWRLPMRSSPYPRDRWSPRLVRRRDTSVRESIVFLDVHARVGKPLCRRAAPASVSNRDAVVNAILDGTPTGWGGLTRITPIDSCGLMMGVQRIA